MASLNKIAMGVIEHLAALGSQCDVVTAEAAKNAEDRERAALYCGCCC